jgi:HEPN domain-containing protein
MRAADAQSWIRSAEEDLVWARVSLEAKLFTRSCFAAQQSVEKALKALLVARTAAYPRVHTLLELLSLVVEVDPSLQDFRPQCEVLDKYYTPTRYPEFVEEGQFDSARAKEALELAEEVVKSVVSRIVAAQE